MNVLYIYADPAQPESNDLVTKRHYDAMYSDCQRDRMSLEVCIAALRPGDTLYVPGIAHLADRTDDIVDVLRRIASRGVDVHFGYTEETLNSGTSPFLDVTMEAVQAFKNFRNAFMRRRARQGVKRARSEGRIGGRPVSPLPKGFAEVARLWLSGEITAMRASARLGISMSTFVRKARALQKA